MPEEDIPSEEEPEEIQEIPEEDIPSPDEEAAQKLADLEARNSNLMSMFNKEQGRANDAEEKLKGLNPVSESDEPDYYKEDWEPKSMGELGKALKTAEQRGADKALQTSTNKEVERAKAKEEVDNFVAETKTTDKAFNEKDFFGYVSRHKIPINRGSQLNDLKSAYSSYKELIDSGGKIEKKVKENIQNRQGDTINTSGQGGKTEGGMNVKGKSMFDIAKEGLHLK